ncbi:uncharacterized protein CCR75_002741 [Bremia lactucae]|uniref:Uncharacterized protein n=1 Tax=Bremia lactucae TaxID=4779 RepID=A0A976IBP6_BRELC|nr:hypothetical protein CCR75_002741 [Bremia lactucae]
MLYSIPCAESRGARDSAERGDRPVRWIHVKAFTKQEDWQSLWNYVADHAAQSAASSVSEDLNSFKRVTHSGEHGYSNTVKKASIENENLGRRHPTLWMVKAFLLVICQELRLSIMHFGSSFLFLD